MGRWAQRQKRGGGGLPFQALPAPELTTEDPDVLNWVWLDAPPSAWQIEQGDDIDGPFTVLSTVPGTDSSAVAPDPSKFYRIIGITAGNPVTSYSATVTFA